MRKMRWRTKILISTIIIATILIIIYMATTVGQSQAEGITFIVEDRPTMQSLEIVSNNEYSVF
ncbi:hypothetical protein D8M04_03115 [Oceanobacillus piezotolerans]|uniref:Uncharacterized protein n=1 Tax=Oceanobacillus piezotolerans TaxID=2448030 RepID=A0A498DGG0_9BACI|nr:hypothetical protein [Oceanobacillus piezotolerans]RLL48278.1 hypothetical protein D8M04_03115 [Oceanobacillus piezotolerans]